MGLIRYLKTAIPQKYKNTYHLIVAFFAVLFFRYPAKNLKVIGVTGTDGKTTTSTLIYEILRKGGKKVALVSTVAAYVGKKELDTGFHVTAPDPWLLQKLLRKVADMKYEYVVLEATSHGLDQHRLLGTKVKIGVLTNITHEHLDYHKTYKNYVSAKGKLFRSVNVAIINKTDESYSKIKHFINSDAKIISYGADSASPQVKKVIFARFPEKYNQLNATAAYFAGKSVGINDKDSISAIKSFKGIEGRMEDINNKKGIRIIVDFAHTPNALEKVLSALKHQIAKEQRLISIFGCASERDDKKRPMMGEISTRIADISVFTAEDPRREDIDKIIGEMIIGAKKVKNSKELNINNYKSVYGNLRRNYYIGIPERGEAISIVINKLAKKGDIVVICGKGHEKSMSYNGIEYPWSDQKAVEIALKGEVLKIPHN